MNYNKLITSIPEPVMKGNEGFCKLYYFAWELAAKNIRKSFEVSHMGTAWAEDGANRQWVWDLSFVALFSKYADSAWPTMGAYDIFYKLQSPDGYIGMAYDFDTGRNIFSKRINPPLFAWTEWEYYRTTGDNSRLSSVVKHIELLMNWIDKNRMTEAWQAKDKNGNIAESLEEYQLYYFADCGSSGMDDSPRTPRNRDAGQFFQWIDISSQMALSFNCLAKIYNVLGNDKKNKYWKARANKLGKIINEQLWSEKTKFYYDSTCKHLCSVKTVAGFWPILAGICPQDRIKSLIKHLMDKKTFNRPIPIPSPSADDLNYCDAGTYWRGGVWAPTNYMTVRGLMQNGFGDVAHKIAFKYLQGLQDTFNTYEPHTLWECQSPEKTLPGRRLYRGDIVRPDFVGWSGLGPIAMFIENILGFDIDIPNETITWDIRLTCSHGLKKINLGDGATMDITCEQRADNNAAPIINTRTDIPIKLVIRYNNNKKIINIDNNILKTIKL